MKEINRFNENFLKYLLTSENNEDILLNLVNSVLQKNDLELINELKIADFFDIENYFPDNNKESIFDIRAKTKDDCNLIEIHFFDDINIFNNVHIFSLARKAPFYLSLNAVKGYNFNIININFLNFDLNFENDDVNGFYQFADIKNKNNTIDAIQIHTIEMPIFCKIEKNLKEEDYKNNHLYSWIDFLINPNLEDIRNKLKESNPIMEKVLEKYELFKNNNK